MRVSKKTTMLLLTFLVMILWGSIFPCIKVGYKAFEIDTSSTANILLFAGIRFLVCGIIILIAAKRKGDTVNTDIKTSILPILLTGFFAVVLHYAFTYIGLSVTESSKTALFKQLGVLIYICFAFLFVKEERFSIRRTIGGLIGFLGISAMNFSGGKLSFSMGELLIFLASICTVVSNLTGKKALKNNSSLIVTGMSQFFGGLVLTAIGLAFGAKVGSVTPFSAFVFTYICVASIVGYCLWHMIVSKEILSGLFLIKFAEPVFAGIFGWMILGEDIFNIRYLAAVVLIGAGIFVGSYSSGKTDGQGDTV